MQKENTSNSKLFIKIKYYITTKNNSARIKSNIDLEILLTTKLIQVDNNKMYISNNVLLFLFFSLDLICSFNLILY